MAFVRKEDCPSIIDNICQNLEAKFWGRTYYVTCCFDGIYSFKKKSYFMGSLFRVHHLKAHPNAPFLHKTNSKIHRNSD